MEMRTRALARGRVPDELDRLLRVAPPAVWVAVSALAVAVCALLLWGFTGHLPRSLAAPGVLRGADPWMIQSQTQGRVVGIGVPAGTPVRAGQPIVQLTVLEHRRGHHRLLRTVRSTTLRAPSAGIVSSINTAPGEVVSRGSALYTLQPATDAQAPLQVVLFLPRDNGAIVAPGMRADLSVDSAPSSGFGVLRGVVQSVGSYPASLQTLIGILGNANLARVYSQKGPPLVARIRLDADARTRSGLRWSTRSGPPFRLTAGTGVSGQITEQVQSPIDALFGAR